MLSHPNATRALALAAALILGITQGAGLLFARDDRPTPKVEAQHILTAPLAGEPGKAIDIQIYTFPPESAVPWHIHPGAHEIEYGLAGTLMIQEDGKPPYPLKAGETNYLRPDVIHRGWNPSKTEPAKIYVVRIKPANDPLTTLKEPNSPVDEDAPQSGAYPEAAE